MAFGYIKLKHKRWTRVGRNATQIKYSTWFSVRNKGDSLIVQLFLHEVNDQYGVMILRVKEIKMLDKWSLENHPQIHEGHETATISTLKAKTKQRDGQKHVCRS